MKISYLDKKQRLHVVFLVYFFFLCILLLRPFQIDISLLTGKNNNVSWLENSNGIAFSKEGQIISVSPAVSLLDALQNGNGLTLEAWIATNVFDQDGPARIISYSLDTSSWNFTLGHSQNNLILRYRISDTDLYAGSPLGSPLLELAEAFTSADPVHIVITHDFSTFNLYRNGQLELSKPIPSDRFLSWDPSHYFILGNEATGDRPWHGTLYYLAVYNRALSEEVVNEHYELGWQPLDILCEGPCRTPDGLVVNYLFEEGHGDRVGESDAAGNSLQLHIPLKIIDIKRSYLSTVVDLNKPWEIVVVILNVLVFIPLGLMLHRILSNRHGSSFNVALLTFALGSLLSFAVENIQFIMPTRNSSLIDLFCNMLGMAIGIQMDRYPPPDRATLS